MVSAGMHGEFRMAAQMCRDLMFICCIIHVIFSAHIGWRKILVQRHRWNHLMMNKRNVMCSNENLFTLQHLDVKGCSNANRSACSAWSSITYFVDREAKNKCLCLCLHLWKYAKTVLFFSMSKKTQSIIRTLKEFAGAL